METEKRRYSLLTAITMIVGICIGSGIFFKSDNILVATNGSVVLGVVVFILAAISIIFGGISISQLASRTDTPGGIVGYADVFAGKKYACGIGWFQILIYYPGLVAVVSWVVGVYFCLLFGINGTIELQILIGLVFVIVCYLYNILSPKFGGYFQNATTFIKILPLVIIGFAGLFFGNPTKNFAEMSPQLFSQAGWITAIGPIAFSYDGWVISTAIGHEIKNSKRNLPIALIGAPIFIMIIYVLYFIGVSSYMNPAEIMSLGDKHVSVIANNLLGNVGEKVILTFVLISVMGTVNGIILGFIRIPYSLANHGNIVPWSNFLKKESGKSKVPVNSAVVSFVLVILWVVAHYITLKFNLLPNSDVSEVSIVASYVMYIILYFQVFKLWLKGEIKSKMLGIVVPAFATIGSLFILYGGMMNDLFVYYASFCLLIFISALVYYYYVANKQKLKK